MKNIATTPEPAFVLAISGVGDPAPSDVQRALHKGLTDAMLSVAVEEFYWNKLAAHSARREDNSAFNYVAGLAETIAILGAVEPASTTAEVGPLYSLGRWAYASAISLVAALVALCFAFPLIAATINVQLVSYDSTFAYAFTVYLPTVLRATVVSLLSAVFMILVCGALQAVSQRSGTAVRIALRRSAIALLHPILVAFTALALGDIAIIAAAAIFCVSGPLVLLGIALVASVLTNSPLPSAILDLQWAAWIAGFAVAVGFLRPLVSRRLLRPAFKLLLDVSRYIGDAAYRSELQAGLDAVVSNIPVDRDGRRRIVIVAHSLGSVIALDSLSNSPSWLPTDRVTLVTAGSPLRRSIARFFPNQLFPTPIAAASRHVASRLGSFVWVNVYRPLDYVGTRLCLSSTGAGPERSTRQRRRFVSAHLNYWDDPAAVAAVLECLASATPVPKAIPRSFSVGASPPDVSHARHLLRWAAKSTGPAIWIIAVAASVIHSASLRDSFQTNAMATYHLRVTDGVRGVASVIHVLREFDNGDTVFLQTDDLTFLFDSQLGLPAVRLTVPRLSDVTDQHADKFDYPSLISYVQRECRFVDAKPWYRTRVDLPCRVDNLAVRYLEASPAGFALPDFPPRPSRRIGLLVIVAINTGAAALVILQATAYVFSVFSGLPHKH